MERKRGACNYRLVNTAPDYNVTEKTNKSLFYINCHFVILSLLSWSFLSSISFHSHNGITSIGLLASSQFHILTSFPISLTSQSFVNEYGSCTPGSHSWRETQAQSIATIFYVWFPRRYYIFFLHLPLGTQPSMWACYTLFLCSKTVCLPLHIKLFTKWVVCGNTYLSEQRKLFDLA